MKPLELASENILEVINNNRDNTALVDKLMTAYTAIQASKVKVCRITKADVKVRSAIAQRLKQDNPDADPFALIKMVNAELKKFKQKNK